MTSSIEIRLPAFLADQAAKPFALGTSDCGLWLADWAIVALSLNSDPAAHLRGRYETLQEWMRFSNGGGLYVLIEDIASGLSLKKTVDPKPGDIGVIRVGETETGAIMGFQGWVVRSGFSTGGPGLARIYNADVRCAWRMA